MGEGHQPGNVSSFIGNKDSSYPCTWTAGKKRNLYPMWKRFMKHVDLEKPNRNLVDEHKQMFESLTSAGTVEKLRGSGESYAKIATCEKMREPILRMSNQEHRATIKKSPHLSPTITSSKRRNWKRLEMYQTLALESSSSAQSWRATADQTLGRELGTRLARSISYIHFTRNYRRYGHVGNTAAESRLGLPQDSDFLVMRRPRVASCALWRAERFVPISWTCKKQSIGLTQYHRVGNHSSLTLD